MGGNYILDGGGEPVECVDLMAFSAWYGSRSGRTDWIVGKTVVGGYEVSTVFLAIDHNFGGCGAPILWETMVFHAGGGYREAGDHTRRYTSRSDAVRGHAEVVAEVVLGMEGSS